MRPSRSHESLSSPLKPSNTNLENQNDVRKYSHFTRINHFLASSRSKQSQTTSVKTKSSSSNLEQFQLVDNIIKLNLNNETNSSRLNLPSTPSRSNTTSSISCLSTYQPYINSIHNSLFNEENCFEIKCLTNTISILDPVNKSRILEKSDSSERDEPNYEPDEADDFFPPNKTTNRSSRRDKSDSTVRLKPRHSYSTQNYTSRYFMCRTSEEREKWIQCLRDVSQPNLLSQRHDENSIQAWILEAKGQAISSKPNKKYFCEIYLNNTLYARSCSKDKKEILFWGENFDFK